MPRVVRALRHGQPVTLTYRHKVIGTIQPATGGSTPLRGSPEAIRRGFLALDNLHVPDEVKNDPRSMKQRLAELRERDR